MGGNPDNVAQLAAAGVAYVIVAHLFFRGVATCANAIPFLPDAIFDQLNPDQRPGVGLTDLGFQIVERLFQSKVIVDITHCTEEAVADVFQVASGYLGQPVISSHNGVQATSDYPLNLSPQTINLIVGSGGVVGIILFPHWLRQPADQLFGVNGFPLLFNALDYLASVTGGYDHVAIGTDLDGFIEPIAGCENYAQTPALVTAIQNYCLNKPDTQAAEKILWRNALGVLQKGWQGVGSE